MSPELPTFQVFCFCCYRGICYLCQGAFKCEDGLTLFQSETAIMDFYTFHSVHCDTIVTVPTNKIHTLPYNHNSVLIYAYSYTVIDKTLTHASETWTLTKREREKAIKRF
jgi:hypothetical protein